MLVNRQIGVNDTLPRVVEWGLGSLCRAHLLVENMTPAEYVAQRTWSILGRTRELRGRFGEESLTDLLQLEMLSHQRTKGFWLRPTTKQQEAWCGADLLVAVRHWTSHWSVFVL